MNQELTTEQREFLQEGITLINGVFVAIKKQLMIVQHEVAAITGSSLKKAHLMIDHINEETGKIEQIEAEGEGLPEDLSELNLSAAELEIKLTVMVEEKKREVRDIKLINEMIEKALANNLTTGSVELTAPEVIELLVILANKITENKVDEVYNETAHKLESDIKMSAISSTESTLLYEIEDLLMLLSITTSVGIAEQSEALIGVRGLVVRPMSPNLSFDEQKAFLDNQIEANRENCENMDQVAKSITSLLSRDDLRVVCADTHDEDCDDALPNAQELFKEMVRMTQLVVEDIEDHEITVESQKILALLAEITIVTREQKEVYSTMSESIQGDVLIYVSQISIVESKRLDIEGALAFEGATTTIDQIDVNDFVQRTSVLKAQLTNLFQINDAVDKVVECIEKIEELPEPHNPESNHHLKHLIDSVPALASKAVPPVQQIQNISAEIIHECSTMTEQKTEADMKSIKFIKNPLVAFEQMFISQISVFSQQLAIITGHGVTAYNLEVLLISHTGELEVAHQVDVSDGTDVHSKEYYIQRYQLMKSTLYTLDLVMQRMIEVLSITEDGEPEEGSILPMKFALKVVHYVSHSLSEGVITAEKMTAAQKILKSRVTAAPSNMEKLILNKALSTVTSLKLTILAEIVNYKVELIAVLEENHEHIADITFVIQSFDESGEFIEIEETEFSSTDATELQNGILTMRDSQEIMGVVQHFLSVTNSLDYTNLTTEPTVEVTQAMFMSKVTSFTLQMGKNFKADALSELRTELLTYKLIELSGAAITKLNYVMFIIQSFRILISEEIVDVRSQIGESLYIANCPDFPDALTAEEEAIAGALVEIRDLLGEVLESVETVSNSSDHVAAITATDFFHDALEFFFDLSDLDLAEISAGLSQTFREMAEKIISDSKAGISMPSGEFKLVYHTISQSVKIIRMVLQLQIDVLCPPKENPTIEKYRRLKSNEDAVLKMQIVIEMINNQTDFLSLPPADCGALPDSALAEVSPFPSCVDNSTKPSSIIMDLSSGILTGLKNSLDDSSIFSTIDAVVKGVFKFSFEAFSDSDAETLEEHSGLLGGYLADIRVEIQNLSDHLAHTGIDSSEIEFHLVFLPPCQPAPLDPLTELTDQLTGLLSNLYSLETVAAAVEAVLTGPAGESATSVEDFITSFRGLLAMLRLNSPCELDLSVIQEISALLVGFSLHIQQATEIQIVVLQDLLGQFTSYLVEVIVQINIVQGHLLQFTGATLNPLQLDILTIGADGLIGPLQETGPTVPPSPLLPSEEEQEILVLIQFLQILLSRIELIIIMLQQVITGTFVIDVTSTYSCDNLFDLIMRFVSLLMKGQFDGDLTTAADAVLAISSLSAVCGQQTIGFLQIILLVLTEVNINVIGAMTILTQSLVLSKGLIISINLGELSQQPLANQTAIFESVLESNRLSCKGMDDVALQLEIFLATLTCSEDAEQNNSAEQLIGLITNLTKIAATNIEDDTILSLTQNILTLLSSGSLSLSLHTSQCKAIENLVIIIQNVVLTYVSQISIVEQNRLLLGGRLSFSPSLDLTVGGEEDFTTLTSLEEAQLKGLMRCGDFTDRTRLSLALARAGPALPPAGGEEGESCEGREVARAARRVTAMCSSAVLPLEEVAASTSQLARCSSSLDSPLTPGQLAQMDFLLGSLATFRLTFTSQISLVQQSLTFLTGQSVTASALGLSFIDETGGSYPAPALDITGGNTDLVPVTTTEVQVSEDNRVGMELFLKKQWREFRFAFSTLQIVIKSIELVLEIEGVNEITGADFTSGAEFLEIVDVYYTKIGQGLFNIDGLFDVTFNIIEATQKVSIEVSGRIVLLLRAMLFGLRSYQMSCISEFIIIQQKMIQIGLNLASSVTGLT